MIKTKIPTINSYCGTTNKLAFTGDPLRHIQIGAPAKITVQGNKMKKRIVQVFIVDTDEQVPLKNSILYKGDQELTDSTDQELFYEISIKEILNKHNEYRSTIKKKGSEDEFLEPIRIRDLEMTVTTVAEF